MDHRYRLWVEIRWKGAGLIMQPYLFVYLFVVAILSSFSIGIARRIDRRSKAGQVQYILHLSCYHAAAGIPANGGLMPAGVWVDCRQNNADDKGLDPSDP